ncbi:hypothetical protein CJ179_49695 [Rhodococcus sp. ACS1]|nr:hypothetical protein CJ179_49695 [Rhodococcus sp. ACS1]
MEWFTGFEDGADGLLCCLAEFGGVATVRRDAPAPFHPAREVARETAFGDDARLLTCIDTESFENYPALIAGFRGAILLAAFEYVCHVKLPSINLNPM